MMTLDDAENNVGVEDKPSPKEYRYMLSMMIYPFKCPHCHNIVEAPEDKVFPKQLFPVGTTKKAFSARKKPRKELDEDEVYIESEEVY